MARPHSPQAPAAPGRRWPARVSPAAVALLVALACTPPPVVREFVIGATLPLSGGDAAIGQAMRRGYLRAVEEINRAGGLAVGQQAHVAVRLDVRDDRGEASRAEQFARELLGDGAHLLLATPVAIRAVSQAAVAEQLGRPLVVNAQDGEGLPGPRARWTVVVPASGDVEARAYAVASRVLRAAAHVHSTDPGVLREALRR